MFSRRENVIENEETKETFLALNETEAERLVIELNNLLITIENMEYE